MSQLPDVSCLIKVLTADGKRLSDGGGIFASEKATVRYVVFNDTDKPVGPFTIVGTLSRNGVRVQPNGKPNVVPAQQITLKAKQIWTSEFTASEKSISDSGKYIAKLLVDVGNILNEEDEANNSAQTTFSISGQF